ncbi:hypothetical protein [Porphyromonas sp. COT-239 OH1446]|uniref:hypothetical protein n=1 Tax=Porphyromonas sp. COT-239 OH1446 TaxID=1515613 RepID=UPI00052C87E1|nr:hypothetical protein [Porphyromonas sp. COT-239 OH1446]KGN71379.1 hypothetical protein HQ37_02730 [Porphyromonas sp. COT-239 OH1446]
MSITEADNTELQDKLSHIAPENIHQLPEYVPIQLQKQYIEQARSVRRQRLQGSLALDDEEIISQARELFAQETMEVSELRKQLVLLASTASIEALRLVQELLPRLKAVNRSWALMAELDLKMSVVGSLVDADQVMLASGLGGRGHLIRLHGFVTYRPGITIEPYQERILVDELLYQVGRVGGEVESYEFAPSFMLFGILLPVDSDMERLLGAYIASCNEMGGFLSRRSFITNTHPLTLGRVTRLLELAQQELSPEPQ